MSEENLNLGKTRVYRDRTSNVLSERLIGWVFALCGWLSILVTVGIVWVLLHEAVLFFQKVSFSEFFGDTQWTPLYADKHFGIWPLICGTVLTSGIAICVALPLGLLAAIYLSEYASVRVRAILKPMLEVLAGIPTIVYGFFALVVVTPLLQYFLPSLAGFNALSPGLVMGIMITPMISSLSEDALFAVPDTLREGAIGLGARGIPTVFLVLLPSAFSGISAAVLLAVSRAIGETMIVAIAAGQQATFTFNPLNSVQTLTAYIIQVSMGDTPTGTLEYQTIFAVAMSLFVITLGVNMISQRLSRQFRKQSGQ